MARRPVTPVVSTKTAEEENMDLFMEEMLGDMSPDPEPAPAPAPALDLSALLDPPSASLTFEDAAPLPPSDPPTEPDAEPMTEDVLIPTFVDMTEEELIASVDGYLSLPDNVKSEMAAGRRRNWETDLAKYMAAS
jgi:hypothetical protein